MIRRRDHEWLPFWRHRDGSWVVSVRYTVDDQPRIGVTVPARYRIVALWHGLRGNVRDGIG